MRNGLIGVLALALVLSWLGFWTYRDASRAEPGGIGVARAADVVTVWINELIGSPDEAYYYELEDLWNSTHPDVRMKMSVMSHAGYQSKLRVAIASGQPPDVCMGGYETLEGLKYTGKAADLSVPIPEEFLPARRVEAMGGLVQRVIVRDGRPTVFPVYRYSYGGVLLANREMLREAGFDDEQIRREGWTFAQFRDACRRMTRDTNGDGRPDIWGFGAALTHLHHLFLNEFGPGVWGKEIARGQFLVKNAETGRWGLDPSLTIEHLEQVFLLFHQLLNEDKTWNPSCLGMNWDEINRELIERRRLGMTFGESPWAAKLRTDIWDAEEAMGVRHESPRPDLTVVWMPTLRAGDRPVPRAGVLGFSVLKQTPYKGDEHTANALRAALFLSHPTHLARSQLRKFRHLPPDPVRFGRIFPELVVADDPWVAFYNGVMDSDIPVVPEPVSPEDPAIAQYVALRTRVDRWVQQEGIGFLEEVMYRRLTAREAAERFYSGLASLAARNEPE